MSVLRSLGPLRILAVLAMAGSFLPAAMAQDVDPPVLLSAILQPDLTTIILTVNDPLETAPLLSAAEDPLIYALEEVGGFGLEFPVETIDTVYILNNGTSSYKQPYQFLGGLGWLSASVDDEGLDGPTIPVGTGFFIQSFTVGSTSWDRTVVVGP